MRKIIGQGPAVALPSGITQKHSQSIITFLTPDNSLRRRKIYPFVHLDNMLL
jgi:hypothetical protein